MMKCSRDRKVGLLLLRRTPVAVLVFLLLQPSHSNGFAFLQRPSSTIPSRSREELHVHPQRRCSVSSSLFAKPKAKPRKPLPDSDPSSSTIPANLRRKVAAKRPALGHIVPQYTKVKGTGGSHNPKLRPQGKAREAGLNNPSMLKIFGGTARGRRLDSPTTVYLRPMMGKVREAVYSSLTSFGLYNDRTILRHLDLFAGSGSVGLESMSRGARHCTFCDLSEDCCSAVYRNVRWCQFASDDDNDDDDDGHYSTRIVTADVLQLLRDPIGVGIPEGEQFGIITMCPPYEEVVYADLLAAAVDSPVVGEDTIVVVEYPVELWGDIPHVIAGEQNTMVGIRNRRYGRTVIAMYVVNPTGRIENAESRPEEFI